MRTAAMFLLALPAAMADTNQATVLERHTAECIAALEVKADDLAVQVKAGQAPLRDALMTTLELGAAFIGNAYLQGERDEARMQALRTGSLESQKSLSDADLAARQSACAREGAQLLSQADFIGRIVVSQLAQRRLRKLLGE